MNQIETYFDIVWQQFKKNRAAYYSLWVLVPLFAIAIFAPLLASNLPLVFHDEENVVLTCGEDATTVYPGLGAPKELVKKNRKVLKKFDAIKRKEAFRDTKKSWYYDDGQYDLWLKKSGEWAELYSVGQLQKMELNAETPVAILPGIALQTTLPPRAPNLETLSTLPQQSLVIRDGDKTWYFSSLATPKLEEITDKKQQKAAVKKRFEFSKDKASVDIFVIKKDDQNEDYRKRVDRYYRLTYSLPASQMSPQRKPLLAGSLAQFNWQRTISPWFNGLFNPDRSIDLVFNLAMLLFPILLIIAFVIEKWFRKVKISRIRRTAQHLGLYLVLIFASTLLVKNVPGFFPKYPWKDRTFAEEEVGSENLKVGWYAPCPFSPSTPDTAAAKLAPLKKKDLDYGKGPSQDSSGEYKDYRFISDTATHWLGTDTDGRDVLARMIYGTRISLTIGFIAVAIYMSLGIIIGAVAGYFGGWVDIIISRIIEVMMLFPVFFLVLILVGSFQGRELLGFKADGLEIYIIMFVIGITGWPRIARLIRGEVLKQREIDYVQAAKALGVSNARTIFRHILPNSLGPAMVAVPFGIASAIITEAGLSLLGIGGDDSSATWGRLLNMAREDYYNWWLILVPSIAIFLTVTIFNLVGNGLRDAMDPKLRK